MAINVPVGDVQVVCRTHANMIGRDTDPFVDPMQAVAETTDTASSARPRLWRTGALFAAIWLAGGCATFQYYTQATTGQLEVLRTSRPIDSVIAHPDTEASLRDRLLLADRIIDFARLELGLDAGNSYRRYAALGRPFVVWNLFSAPPLSLDARRWCYPFVGCVPYRGYFNRNAALKAEARLARQGYETYVAGVPAYSTLGWFDDPLLSTFIDWPEPRLAELLLHEIAHQRVWVRDDAAFNESFATFAGETGARLWFQKTGREAEFDRYVESRQDWQRLRALLLETRAQLESVYWGEGDEQLRIREKTRVFEAFRHCYRQHKPLLGGGAFDGLVAAVNNAYLAAFGTYTDWHPAFAELYGQVGGWTAFLEAIDTLADLATEERKIALEALNPKRDTRGGELDSVLCD